MCAGQSPARGAGRGRAECGPPATAQPTAWAPGPAVPWELRLEGTREEGVPTRVRVTHSTASTQPGGARGHTLSLQP